MAKASGLGARLFVDGVDLSGDIGSLNRIGGGPATLDVTGIDKSGFERIGGVRDGSIEFTAWFNDAAGAEHAVLKTLPTADRLVTYCHRAAIGAPAACCNAKQINYDPTRGADGALSEAVQAQADGFGLEWGELLTAGVRTDVAATNGASLDGLAATTFGLQAYLHVFAFTGTSVTIKLQDSADNVTFADVAGGAFAAVSAAPGTQRISAAPASLRQFVRAVTTGTFSNVQFAVVLVRNQVATVF